MKIFICGPARHGKDTVADILKKSYGLTHESSSHFCMRLFLRDALEARYGLVYDSDEACFEDRVHHRKAWYDLIHDYNHDDRAKLAKALFAEFDIYVGIRDREEFLVARDLSDLSIWVDARPRLAITGQEAEFADKLVRETDCDVTLKNDGTLIDLRFKVYRLFENFVPLLQKDNRLLC